MIIHLKQAEIIIAVSDYIAKMGISRPIAEIDFTRTLNPTSISAEISLQDVAPIAGEVSVAPRVALSKTQPAEAQADAKPAKAEKVPAAKAEVVPIGKTQPFTPIVETAVESDPTVDAETETQPAIEDVSEEAAAPVVTKKKLFGN